MGDRAPVVDQHLVSVYYADILRGAPEELEDAAIDGCGSLQILVRIVAVIRAGHGHDRPVYGCESMELLFSALIYLNDRDMYPRKL